MCLCGVWHLQHWRLTALEAGNTGGWQHWRHATLEAGNTRRKLATLEANNTPHKLATLATFCLYGKLLQQSLHTTVLTRTQSVS